MGKHPTADVPDHTGTTPRSAAPHNRDRTNPGALWAFGTAAAPIGGLGPGFVVGGLAGLGRVMVTFVPATYLVLVTIPVGR